jgi:hypothetical protein
MSKTTIATITTYTAVRACSIAMLAGTVLQVCDVSAGNGSVIDWRTVSSGETLLDGADAFDAAHLFVELVGPEVAHMAATRDMEIAPPPPEPEPEPEITTWMRTPNGRARTIEVGVFRITVDAIGSNVDGDAQDEAHATFVVALAMAAQRLPERDGPAPWKLAAEKAMCAEENRS